MKYLILCLASVALALAAFVVVRYGCGPAVAISSPVIAAGANATAPVPAAAQVSAEQQARQKELAKEFEDASAGVAASPQDVRALERLAEVQFRMGRFEDARKTFEQARVLAPGSVRPLYGIAVCRSARGDYKGALEAYLLIKAAHPDEPGLDQRIADMSSMMNSTAPHP